MSLIGLVVTLIVIGVLLWLLNTHIPMDPTIKKIINILVIIVVVLWILQQLGVLGSLGQVRVSAQQALGLAAGG